MLVGSASARSWRAVEPGLVAGGRDHRRGPWCPGEQPATDGERARSRRGSGAPTAPSARAGPGARSTGRAASRAARPGSTASRQNCSHTSALASSTGRRRARRAPGRGRRGRGRAPAAPRRRPRRSRPRAARRAHPPGQVDVVLGGRVEQARCSSEDAAAARVRRAGVRCSGSSASAAATSASRSSRSRITRGRASSARRLAGPATGTARPRAGLCSAPSTRATQSNSVARSPARP